jgi:hypothetical protein
MPVALDSNYFPCPSSIGPSLELGAELNLVLFVNLLIYFFVCIAAQAVLVLWSPLEVEVQLFLCGPGRASRNEKERVSSLKEMKTSIMET